MSLQTKTIQRYRQLFPKDTLREVSARTGIQITRVFRLFNGKNMKVGELEAFENVIEKKIAENPSFSRFSVAMQSASSILTNDEIARLAEYVERKIAVKHFSRGYVSLGQADAIIA
jgi:hypothetical protein